jgi:hypothetical protein
MHKSHSFNKSVLNIYYMSDTIQGVWPLSMNKINKRYCLNSCEFLAPLHVFLKIARMQCPSLCLFQTFLSGVFVASILEGCCVSLWDKPGLLLARTSMLAKFLCLWCKYKPTTVWVASVWLCHIAYAKLQGQEYRQEVPTTACCEW